MFNWLGKIFGNRTVVEAQHDNRVLEPVASICTVFTDIALSGAKYPVTEWCDYAQDTGVPLPDFHS
jgi:hypothetical protein